jgi:hypothetical protein
MPPEGRSPILPVLNCRYAVKPDHPHPAQGMADPGKTRMRYHASSDMSHTNKHQPPVEISRLALAYGVRGVCHDGIIRLAVAVNGGVV